MARTLSPAVRSALDDAVDEVVYRRGLHEATLDDISRRAEVGRPAIYRHLGSRDAVLVDYLERRAERRNASLVASIAAAGPGRRARLAAMVDWFASWIEEPEFRGCGFQRAVQQRSDGVEAVAEITRRQKAWILDRFVTESDRPTGRHLFLLVEGAMAAGAYEATAQVASDLRNVAAELIDGLDG